MSIHIREVEKYFKEKGIKSKSFRLDAASVITDPEKFVQSHLDVLKAIRPGVSKYHFYPYYNRLLKFYEHEQRDNKGTVSPA